MASYLGYFPSSDETRLVKEVTSFRIFDCVVWFPRLIAMSARANAKNKTVKIISVSVNCNQFKFSHLFSSNKGARWEV